jgi:hypothetical protein
MNSSELSKHSNSLGLIFDQGDQEVYPLGSAWLVDPNTVVTCAHNVVLYKDHLAALKVRFPISGKEFAVRSVTFHAKLDLKHLIATAKRALGEPLVALALEKHNVAILKIAPGVQPVNPVENKSLNEIFKADKGETESGLGGSLAEIELALVLQTITNARKEGTVTIVDERGRVSGRLFCQQGRVSHAYYKNLVNEMAVNQIVERKLTGGFYFTSEAEPDWTTVAEINRPTDSLLIEAHRRLDELDKLAGIVGGPSSLFERLTPDPRLDVLPVDCREFAKLIWPLLDGGTPLGFMWELCGIDDYSVYMTLQELIKTRQISYFEAPFVKAGPAIPIQLGTEKVLAVGDEISALWVDDPSMAPLVRTGKILGSLTEFDPAHVIHTIGLPSSASGAPIIKEEVVIGMHCGALPPDSGVGPTEGYHQMVWVESIVECLNQAGEKEIVKRLTLADQEITVPGMQPTTKVKNPGIREVARIQCPKCGRSTLELTNFCKGCGHRLLKDQAPSKDKKKSRPAPPQPQVIVAAKGPPLIWAFVMALLAFVGGLGALALMPQPHVVKTCTVTIPKLRWVQPALQVLDETTSRWTDTSNDQIFMPKQQVVVAVQVNKPGYVYCLYKGVSGETALIFPKIESENESRMIGENLVVGSNGILHQDKPMEFKVFEFDEKVGSEKIVLICSTAKLRSLKNPTANTELVNTALGLLERNNSLSGLQTTVEQIGPEYFEAGDAKIGSDGSNYIKDQVYLALVEIKHGNLTQ